VIVVVGGEYERSDIWRELALLVRPEKRILQRSFVHIRAGDVVRVFYDDLDDFSSAFTDGMEQGLLDALEVDPLEEQFDGVHAFAVHR